MGSIYDKRIELFTPQSGSNAEEIHRPAQNLDQEALMVTVTAPWLKGYLASQVTQGTDE
jgi:hypothetical protein